MLIINIICLYIYKNFKEKNYQKKCKREVLKFLTFYKEYFEKNVKYKPLFLKIKNFKNTKK